MDLLKLLNGKYVFLALCQTKPSWRFQILLKLFLGTKMNVKVLNALGQLCLWQCLNGTHVWVKFPRVFVFVFVFANRIWLSVCITDCQAPCAQNYFWAQLTLSSRISSWHRCNIYLHIYFIVDILRKYQLILDILRKYKFIIICLFYPLEYIPGAAAELGVV